MKLNEVQYPSKQAISEAVERGEITESLGKILQAQGNPYSWSQPMTAEECDAEDARILAEAGIR